MRMSSKAISGCWHEREYQFLLHLLSHVTKVDQNMIWHNLLVTNINVINLIV